MADRIHHVGSIDKLIKGDWNGICDTCDRKRKRSQMMLSYNSGDVACYLTCRDGGCSDSRHPLNSPPPVVFDGKPVPYARPEGQDNFKAEAPITSTQRWGSFHPQMVWGALNGANQSIGFIRRWVWGFFR